MRAMVPGAAHGVKAECCSLSLRGDSRTGIRDVAREISRRPPRTRHGAGDAAIGRVERIIARLGELLSGARRLSAEREPLPGGAHVRHAVIALSELEHASQAALARLPEGVHRPRAANSAAAVLTDVPDRLDAIS